MKKILMLFAAAALVLGAASCQKENFQKALAEGQEKIDYSDDPMGVIKVYIKKDDTKMAFGENEETGKLARSWEEGDVIDGCTLVDQKYKTFQYTVDEVGTDAEGDFVKLKKNPGAPGIPSPTTTERIHFVYAPGAVSFDSETGACSLDLSKQDESHIPAVMVASSTIGTKDDKPHLELDFTNIAAVMAIRDGITLKDVDGVEVTDYTINKVYAIARTKGTLTLNNGAYEISAATPDDFWPTTISPKDGTSFSADDPIYFAALPGNGKISAELRTNKGKFVWETSSAQNLGANAYARIKTKTYNQRAEAEINGTRYAIDDAFAYAQTAEGDVTIKMVENAVTYETITFTKDNGKITLDLNGKNITCNGNKALYAHSDFEIKDESVNPGTISSTGIAVHMYPYNKQATLNITGGKFVSGGYYTSKDAGGVIYSATNASGTEPLMATLNISGGYFKATNEEKASRAVNASGSINISGGKIEASKSGFAFRAYRDFTATISGNAEFIAKKYSPVYPNPDKDGNIGTLNVTGGYLYSEGSEAPVQTGKKHDNAELSINITGGYFNKEVQAAENYYCNSAQSTYLGKTYLFRVSDTPKYVIEIKDGNKFTSLAAAVAEANAAETEVTIKVLDNAFATDTVIINNNNSKKVYIDLNGKTLLANVKLFTDVEVTDGAGNGVLQADAETVTIGSVSEPSDAKFTLNGGTIKSINGDYAIWAEGAKSGKKPNLLVKKGIILAENEENEAVAIRIKYAKATFGDETTVNDEAILVRSVKGMFTSSGSEVQFNKGQFLSTVRGYYFGDSSCKTTINGGVFTSNGTLFTFYKTTTNPEFVVNNGLFSWVSGDFVQSTNTKAEVSGGYYNKELPEICLKVGYICTNTSTKPGYPYEVVENTDDSIIMVGTEKFDNLNEAISKINSSESDINVKFLQSINLEQEIEIENNKAKVTIDLNGKVVKAKGEKDVSAIIVKGALTVVDFIDSVGDGSLDHDTYADGTSYTLTVKSGTVNLNGAKIMNTSSNGFGRIAVGVFAEDANASFNMFSGNVRGGRAIRFGGKSESASAKVVISGGLVEGTYATESSSTYYAVVSPESSYGSLLINGGTIKANKAKSVIYCGKDLTNMSIIITKNEQTGTIPYIYSAATADKTYCIAAATSGDYGMTVYNGTTWNFYTNKSATSYIGTSLTRTKLTSKVKDEYNNEYTHRIHLND